MTCDQPREHENTEGNVARQLVTKVLQYFCGLSVQSVYWTFRKTSIGTYWQQEIHDIHQTQNHIRDIVESVYIGGG